MNPKTLQYLMGHSDIGVTMNVYTHLGLEDAAAEMTRMEEVEDVGVSPITELLFFNISVRGSDPGFQ